MKNTLILEIQSILKQKKDITEIKGVFIYLLIKGHEIVYVGQTTDGMGRISQHINNKEFDSYSIIKCDKSELNAYSGAAEPQFRGVVSHPSGTTEPPFRFKSH